MALTLNKKKLKKLKKSKKNRKSKTHKKIKHNKKIVGRGPVQEIEENSKQTEFEQRNAIINYGSAPISTFNLVNCISVGGTFILPNGKIGSFLTHESPTDYIELQNKLKNIKNILDYKDARIKDIIIFPIDNPAKDIYENGLTTTKIIDKMIDFSNDLFHKTPIVKTYTCEDSSCLLGEVVISPNSYSTNLTPFRNSSSKPSKPSMRSSNVSTYPVEVLYNKSHEKIYRCPICNSVSGTYAPKYPEKTEYFSHKSNCPNQDNIPVEP